MRVQFQHLDESISKAYLTFSLVDSKRRKCGSVMFSNLIVASWYLDGLRFDSDRKESRETESYASVWSNGLWPPEYLVLFTMLV